MLVNHWRNIPMAHGVETIRILAYLNGNAPTESIYMAYTAVQSCNFGLKRIPTL